MSPALFAGVVATAVLLAGAALGLLAYLGLRAGENRRLERRLLGREAVADEFEGADLHDGAAVKWLARGGQRLEKLADEGGETTRRMVQAGWRGARARLLFYALRGGLLVLAVVLTLALWLSGTVAPWMLPLHGFAWCALGYLVPLWLLRARAAARRARMAREVPLFIHLLVLLFEAGLSTRQAFASLVREGRGVLPALGHEFEGVLRQLDAGADLPQVLRDLGLVLEVPDLDGVFGVLRQVDRYGGEIREPLLEALAVLEERRGLDLRERVNLVSGRMTVVMVLFFFPALLIFVAGPAVVAILGAMADVAGGR